MPKAKKDLFCVDTGLGFLYIISFPSWNGLICCQEPCDDLLIAVP